MEVAPVSRHRKYQRLPPRAVQERAQDAGPTPEFMRHHDIREPEISAGAKREAWQVNPRFEQLDPAPDQAMRGAYQRWRNDWDVGMEGVRDKNIFMRTSFDPFNNSYSDHQLDALTRLWACKVAIKEWSFMLIQLCAVEEREWAPLAFSLGYKDYRTARSHTRQAFVDLAQYCDARSKFCVIWDKIQLPDPLQPPVA